MKTLLVYAMILILVGFCVEFEMTFRPFSIKIGDWKGVLGFVLLFVGLSLIGSRERIKSNIEGYQQGLEDMKKHIQDEYELVKKPTTKNKTESNL